MEERFLDDQARYKAVLKRLITIVETKESTDMKIIVLGLSSTIMQAARSCSQLHFWSREWSTHKAYFASGGNMGHNSMVVYVGKKFSIFSVRRVEGTEPVQFRGHDAGCESAFVPAGGGASRISHLGKLI